MATGPEDGKSNPRPIPQQHPSHRGAPTPNAVSAVSPPSKGDLATWWKRFSRKTEKDEDKGVVTQAPGIFGVPLVESIRYANVAISWTNERGESFIYGYVPIVVAKCGVFLKEKATDVEGIFRLSGSAKRINDLQALFNSPDRYGKGLDWTGYTVHDAANILKRYLNQLPEPIVPLDGYERFRDPLRMANTQQDPRAEPQAPAITQEEHDAAVVAYKKLITELPALNRQLLLYILDLLAVFASKSDINRMTASNLAAIFQPGIISHPDHDMAPHEYRLSQDVLIFLIENQDNFLIGMSGTAVDEQTQKEVESGPPSVKSPKTTNIGRSASNASAGADSLRKFGIRRNVSTSSRHSKDRTSPNVSNPSTPSSPPFNAASATGSLGRSNTVPSKRSPALTQQRFVRNTEDTAPTSSLAVASTDLTTRKPSGPPGKGEGTSPATATSPAQTVLPVRDPVTPVTGEPASNLIAPISTDKKSTSRERKISSFFSKSPIFGPSPVQAIQGDRPPRKLQKKIRLPGGMHESATSSVASLHHDDGFTTPLGSPSLGTAAQADPIAAAMVNEGTTPLSEHPPDQFLKTPPSKERQGSSLKPAKSPSASLHSGDPSDPDMLEDSQAKAEKQEARRSRWLFSSARKADDSPLVPPPSIGDMTGARKSNSSIGSSNRPSQSFTLETQPLHQAPTDSSSTGQQSLTGQTGRRESQDLPKDSHTESEKRSLFGKWRAKIQQSKEDRKEREAEKERAKSPSQLTGDNSSSRNSLSAFAHEHFSPRAKSFEKSREDVLSPVNEQPQTEQLLAQTNVVPPTPIEPVQPSEATSGLQTSMANVPGTTEKVTDATVVEAPATETRTDPLLHVTASKETAGVEPAPQRSADANVRAPPAISTHPSNNV